jgi:hypothetical protein
VWLCCSRLILLLGIMILFIQEGFAVDILNENNEILDMQSNSTSSNIKTNNSNEHLKGVLFYVSDCAVTLTFTPNENEDSIKTVKDILVSNYRLNRNLG